MLLVVVGVVIFFVFFGFESILVIIENFLFINFVLIFFDVIKEYISVFVGNVNKMIVVGVGFLVVVFLLFICNVDVILN